MKNILIAATITGIVGAALIIYLTSATAAASDPQKNIGY